MLLAAAKTKGQEADESSPDHIGDALELADNQDAKAQAMPANHAITAPATPAGVPVVNAALKQREVIPTENPALTLPAAPLPVAPTPSSGTVILDIEEGGITVPSFGGKSVRAAIELAEKSDLDLDIVGDGHAQLQSPLPGARVPKGSKVMVRFGR
jgi:hypothetical protein